MKYEGILNLDKNCEYTMVMKGNHYNISKTLNSLLTDTIDLQIRDINSKILFSEIGKLSKDKFDKGFYKLTINKKCFDDILWDLVDRKVTIEFKNKTIERGSF